MRRVVSVVLSVASVIAAVVVAVALSGSAHGSRVHQEAGAVPTLPGSVNIVRYQRGGTTASCTGNSCSGSGSGSSNLAFTLPASPVAYRSILTISFRYSATGAGATFTVGAGLGHGVATQPTVRPLLPTGGGYQAATMVFRPGLLTGGVSYFFSVSADITNLLDTARIAVNNVVYTLQAWIR